VLPAAAHVCTGVFTSVWSYVRQRVSARAYESANARVGACRHAQRLTLDCATVSAHVFP
jgi:hypothetical protein